MALYGTIPEQEVDGKTVSGIKVTIPFPAKSAYVRLPNAAEMKEFFNTTKKKDDTPELRALKMFKAIRQDAGEEWDEFEASAAIDSITFSKGIDYERVGDTYVVTVATPFEPTKHTLSLPTQKQLHLYRRSAVKNYLQAICSLYDELSKGFEGYEATYTIADVPSAHKLNAVDMMFTALDRLDPVLDPNAA